MIEADDVSSIHSPNTLCPGFLVQPLTGLEGDAPIPVRTGDKGADGATHVAPETGGTEG